MAQKALTIQKAKKGAVSIRETAPKQGRPRSLDPFKLKGVGARESTFTYIQKVADDNSLSLNATMRFALEYFVERYQSGEAKQALKSKVKTTKKNVISY